MGSCKAQLGDGDIQRCEDVKSSFGLSEHKHRVEASRNHFAAEVLVVPRISGQGCHKTLERASGLEKKAQVECMGTSSTNFK